MEAACLVYVVSSNERLRTALSRLLTRQEALLYLGDSPNVRAALPLIGQNRPDIVISDSPPMTVSEVLAWREVREHCTRLLMLTSYRREPDAVRALIAGASGLILTPDRDGTHLLDAIRSVAQGDLLIPQQPLARLRAIANAEAPSRLDGEERALLGQIIDGRRNAEIAHGLGMKTEEVPAQIARLLNKLV